MTLFFAKNGLTSFAQMGITSKPLKQIQQKIVVLLGYVWSRGGSSLTKFGQSLGWY